MSRVAGYSKHDASTAMIVDTLGSMVTVPAGAPRMLPIRRRRPGRPRATTRSHAVIDRVAHRSSELEEVLPGRAGTQPSECEMR